MLEQILRNLLKKYSNAIPTPFLIVGFCFFVAGPSSFGRSISFFSFRAATMSVHEATGSEISADILKYPLPPWPRLPFSFFPASLFSRPSFFSSGNMFLKLDGRVSVTQILTAKKSLRR